MTAPQGQQFSLKWNNFSQHIVTAFEDLRGDGEFTDVTLSCEGKRIKCHKVLLSACSVYFKETFRENPCKHPVIILKGVEYVDLQAVVTFMYNGQVNVSQERLSTFLETAELLQIKGLTEVKEEPREAHKGANFDAGTSNTVSCHSALGDTNPLSLGSSSSSLVTSARPVAKRRRIGPGPGPYRLANGIHTKTQKHTFLSNSDSSPHMENKVLGENFRNECMIADGVSNGEEAVTGVNFLGAETETMSSSRVPFSAQQSLKESTYSVNHITTPEYTSETEYEDYKFEPRDLSEDKEEDSIHDVFGEIEDDQNPSTFLTPDDIEYKFENSLTNLNGFSSVGGSVPIFIPTKRGYKIKHNNFMYTKDKSVMEKAYWRCVNCQRYRCKGRLLLVNNQISGTKPHCDLCSTACSPMKISFDNL